MVKVFMRLAPNEWVHSTRDASIRVTRHFVPFWNINLNGSVRCSIGTKSNFPFRHDDKYYSHREWHSFSFQIDDIKLDNINIYADDEFDTYHIQKLDVSFDEDQLVDLTSDNKIIAEPTINSDEAFHNAWMLIVKPLLEDICRKKAQERFPRFEEPRIDSFHLTINSKQDRVLYYPIYEITYYYKSKFPYTCLLDGVTGYIAGDRQFSTMKVTLASFLSFYPIVKMGIFSFGTCLPMAAIVAPCIGLYVRSYPKRYKGGLNQVQWTDDHSKASKFTYNLLKLIEESKNQSKLDSDQVIHVEKQTV
ncbi:unnamed protein product [Adineta ricciae]|uniref:Uncharacterized protein n=1 Tax=Adineta ricciae TaxID=249248 RepID=A0A813VZM8_ADIRI|nr:unnamed protein product [Adineta ricciae]CAF0844964.1 unnamed protein product [Adineta ricciae]